MHDVAPAGAGLVAALESSLPPELPAGSRSALFLMGACFAPGRRLRGLELSAGGRFRPADRFGMPRPDLAHLGDAAASGGFWGLVPVTVPEHGGGPVELIVRARFEDGTEAESSLGSVPVAEPRRAPAPGSGGERIAICMATYEPDPELFAEQVESLKRQTVQDWVCFVSDDASGPEGSATIERVLAGDDRFVLSRSPERLGFYRNFERALSMVPDGFGLVALADQDDHWYPEKLEALRSAIGRAQLVYSDQRLVDREGRVLSETFWRGRSNNHRSFASLLVANSVTGAAAAFRSDLLSLALPFPEGPGWQFHDHWLAAAAMSRGELAYVDRPLYDYVQHSGAILGQVSGDASPEGSVARLKRALRPWLKVSTEWRAAYFFDCMRLRTMSAVLLERGAGELPPHRERVLRRFRDADLHLGTALTLLVRPLRALLGRDETLGSEAQLARGLLWRRLVSAAMLLGRRGRALDCSLPPGGPAAYGATRIRRWRAG